MSKREPAEVWKALVKEAGDDEAEFQRAAGATPDEVDRSLAAKGLDPKAERESAGAWRHEIEQRVAARKRKEAEDRARSRSIRPERRTSPAVLWLVAATLGAAVGGGLVYAAMHRAPAPAPAPAPSTPVPTPEPPSDDLVATNPLVAAETFRRNAFAECNAKQWDTCLAYLDRARALDPAGDQSDRVTKARLEAIKGIEAKTYKQEPR